MAATAASAAIAGYIICATPRSGSTLLCDLLKAAGAGRPASYFHREDIDEWAGRLGVASDRAAEPVAFERAYVEAVRQRGDSGTGLFGLRLMWPSLGELDAWLDRLQPGLPSPPARLAAAFGSLRYIHLSRPDKLRQAISLLKASRSGLWHMGADGTERERVAPSGELAYDAGAIRRIVDELERDDAAWRTWFQANGISPIVVSYDELSADPAAALARVLVALDRDPAAAAAIVPRTAKLADHQSEEWVDRFNSGM